MTPTDEFGAVNAESLNVLNSVVVGQAADIANRVPVGGAAADIVTSATTITGGNVQTGRIESANWDPPDPGDRFAVAGSRFDLDTGDLTTPYLSSDPTGLAVLGDIEATSLGLVDGAGVRQVSFDATNEFGDGAIDFAPNDFFTRQEISYATSGDLYMATSGDVGGSQKTSTVFLNRNGISIDHQGVGIEASDLLGLNLTAPGVPIKTNNTDRIESTPWQSPTILSNGWINFGSPNQGVRFRRNGERVEIQGFIKNGALGATIFNLPPDLRPTLNLNFPCVTAGAVGRLDVRSSGNVSIPNLLGVTNASASINCSFGLG